MEGCYGYDSGLRRPKLKTVGSTITERFSEDVNSYDVYWADRLRVTAAEGAV